MRCLLDEFANIGQIPKFEKLIATIRSREISASIILQSQSQLKAIYVKSFYGELPAGHYRLIKQFAFFESERDWDYDTYNLSCEFTIK